MLAVRGSLLRRRQTSNPSMSGRLMSRIMRLGCVAATSRASLPVAASFT